VPPLLPFAQLDYAGPPEIGAGRYLVRPQGEPEADPDVLVIRSLGAVRAGARLRKGKPVPLEAEPPADALALSRYTLTKALPFADSDQAADWLEQVVSDDEVTTALLEEVVSTVNRALHAYRVSAPDHYAGDLSPSAAIAVRFGYGTGQELADGRWSAATELAEGRRRSMRTEMVDGVGAQERIAGVLGGRDEVRPEETLLLDAERAAAQSRPRLAAMTLGLAIEALVRTGGAPEDDIVLVASRLRERALAGGEIDGAELQKALRSGRRAIRAKRFEGF
jgi:hypothetical protein